MIEAFHTYKDHTISYHKFGDGPRTIIAFHGFSFSSTSFSFIAPAFQPEYTIYSFDMPFHGNTVWGSEQAKLDDIIEIIKDFLSTFKIDKFELMGFSFGARCCQLMVPHFEGLVERVWLFAPLKFSSIWLWTVSRIPMSLRSTIHNNYQRILGGTQFLRRVGLAHRGTVQFMERNLKSKTKRNRVFAYWLSLADYRLDKSLFLQSVKEQGIPINIVFGAYDDISNPKDGKWMKSNHTPTIAHTVPKGHFVIDQELVEWCREVK